MNPFERYLTVWAGLCIVAGVALGHFLPGPFQTIGRMEIAQVNLPVAVLIEVPVMLSVIKIVNASKGWYERTSL